MHIGPSNDILPDSNFGNNNTRVYFHPFACHFTELDRLITDILTAVSNFCWPSLKNGYITLVRDNINTFAKGLMI